MSSQTSGSLFSDALPWAGALITGLVGWSAARYTAFAQLSKTTLDASRQLVDEFQKLRVQDTARILELEAEVLRMRGEIGQHIQKEQSSHREITRLRGRK